MDIWCVTVKKQDSVLKSYPANGVGHLGSHAHDYLNVEYPWARMAQKNLKPRMDLVKMSPSRSQL